MKLVWATTPQYGSYKANPNSIHEKVGRPISDDPPSTDLSALSAPLGTTIVVLVIGNSRTRSKLLTTTPDRPNGPGKELFELELPDPWTEARILALGADGTLYVEALKVRGEDDDRQVRVQPATATFEGDEPVTFTGQVYDGSMTPVSEATVDVTITDSTGTEYPHSMTPLGNGRYDLAVGSLPEGTYQYEAIARYSGRTLGQDQGQFSVGALRLEYQQTRANPVLMRQIAARSGGRAYTENETTTFANDLSTSSTFSPTTVTNTTEAELWRTSFFLAVILALLAAEWTLRKRFGLT
mgnify:CR=1 FL=1